jgi:hypothetical protein
MAASSEAAAEFEPIVFSIRLQLHVPPVVRPGKDVAADNSDPGSGDHVMRMMLAGLDAAVSDEGSQRVSWYPVFPPVPLPHEFGGRERDRGMAGGKRFAAAIRTTLVNRVLQKVGDAKGHTGGRAEFERSASVPVNERESGRGARQHELQNVAGGFDAVLRRCGIAKGAREQEQQQQSRKLAHKISV